MSKDLTEGIKRMALDMGVAKAGIASRENLEGPPEAVTDKILSGARAVVSILVVEPEDKVLDSPRLPVQGKPHSLPRSFL